jgi:HK97 family phage major capsid protein
MTTSVASTSKVFAFGDPQNYVIADRIGMDIEVTQNLFGAGTSLPTGQRGVYAFWRNTANLLAAASFRVWTIP